MGTVFSQEFKDQIVVVSAGWSHVFGYWERVRFVADDGVELGENRDVRRVERLEVLGARMWLSIRRLLGYGVSWRRRRKS